ncbi:12-oxophytodienoate reductase 1 [Phytophthora pseudosyringae]|uniref:12-oxophytodienoate reductase 1 n=1 Tax=Phytophthora pseudosyringae TaxID=221518 RepID=A0A8T1VIK6_9STRA|nr:12-oxophytodienoate reductase 1 [Phytophthora pseudosyringae]
MYGHVLKRLNEYHLAYVHLIEPRSFALHENPKAPTDGSMTRSFREIYDGVLMTASGYDRASAVKAADSGDADLVALGRYFISNPDLVKRLEMDAPLNPYDAKTFYAPGELGYTDQPFLEEEVPKSA